MASVEITIGQSWKENIQYLHELLPYRPVDTALNLIEIRDIIDIVVNGINLTSNIAEDSIFTLIGDLLDALLKLLNSQAQKVILEFASEPWELVLLPYGRRLLVSVYSVDRQHHIMAENIAIDGARFVEAVTQVAETMLTDLLRISERFSADPFVRRFSSQLGQLKRCKYIYFPVPSTAYHIENGLRAGSTTSSQNLSFNYEFDTDYIGFSHYAGESSFDLHALLVKGHIDVEYQGDTIRLSRHYPYLTIQALIYRARHLIYQLESNESGDDFRLDEVMYHAQLNVEATKHLWTLELFDSTDENQSLVVQVSPQECIDGLLTLAELFISDLKNSHAAMELNQRFIDLQDEVTFLRGWFQELHANNLYLDAPEDYLRTQGHIKPQENEPLSLPTWPWKFSQTRAIFPRTSWSFEAQNIDFASLKTSNQDIIFAAANAIISISPTTGNLLWRVDLPTSPPAKSFFCSGDVAVLVHSGQTIEVRNRQTGAILIHYNSKIKWTEIINAAHYDDESLIVLADRDGHLLCLSLLTGEKVWDYSTGVGQFAGVSFHGPLASVLTNEGFVSTLNPTTGEVLWKVRLSGFCECPPYFYQGRLYLLTHDNNAQSTMLHAFYPFTGRTVWQLRLEGALSGTPSFLEDSLVLPLERRGQIVLVSVPVESAHPRVQWQLELSSAGLYQPTPITQLLLDGEPHGLIKTDRAELTCFQLSNGTIRWRTMSGSDVLLLYGNLPLIVINDAVMAVNDSIDIRDHHTGELFYSFYPTESPEFIMAFEQLTLLIGEQGPETECDMITALSLQNYLVEVK